jgi:hypothetical protein
VDLHPIRFDFVPRSGTGATLAEAAPHPGNGQARTHCNGLSAGGCGGVGPHRGWPVAIGPDTDSRVQRSRADRCGAVDVIVSLSAALPDFVPVARNGSWVPDRRVFGALLLLTPEPA